ncbi:Putative aminoacrylate hydrolase RutD [Streptomyces sp. YIM 121038]|uniref:alpha/beta fold hydrolase n=1 Tax=Streptomyces sp. YIM 121038 TaxID=2136401 RepID=UPI001110D44A|nr:alpha/beta hydrolase [Streptomyces sp. YIM 121038]QCX74289.1 Putative aminoacrylate hydrolase RutD [Streptomyces sp. YIM 121038]
MHGGLVDSRFYEPNLGPLAGHFHVYTPERRGHGHIPDVPGPITYELMADDTIPFLEAVVGEPADLVGHSDGAFVAMLVAMRHVVEMYEALPRAELAVVPGTSHFLTQEKPALVNALVLDFLGKEPVRTVAAIRRAQEPQAG